MVALRQTPAPAIVWEKLSSLARFAPSPHNTQPYRLRPKGAVAEVVLLPHRLLPVEDRGLLYGRATAGIFAVAVEEAARANGWRVEVQLRDPGAIELERPQIVVGEARLLERCEPDERARLLLRSRRTSRLPFHRRPVPEPILRELVDTVAAHGHALDVESEPSVVRELLVQNAEAIIENLQIDDDRREIERWLRFGATPAQGDGLWEEPLGQPAWELRAGLAVPGAFQLPGISRVAVRHHVRTTAAPHVALLRGPFSTWDELVAAGRMLMDLWLAMAAHDVYMHPFGSMLTNPAHAARLAARFDADDIWLILRLGFSDPPPAAPRLASVVIR